MYSSDIIFHSDQNNHTFIGHFILSPLLVIFRKTLNYKDMFFGGMGIHWLMVTKQMIEVI